MLDYSQFAFAKPTSVKKTPKPIAQIGKKRKERIKQEGKETDIFKEVWNERPHKCERCGVELYSPLVYNFHHKIPKSRGEEYRLDKTNITMVCVKCHNFYHGH